MTELQTVVEARPTLLSAEAFKNLLLTDAAERTETAPSPLIYHHTTTLNAGTDRERQITAERLTVEGKRQAAVAYEEIANFGSTENLNQGLAQARQEIQAKVTQCRQRDTGEVSREWKTARRVKKNAPQAFKAELQAKLVADPGYQEFIAEQKLLASIAQKVRAEAQKPDRDRIKAGITAEDLASLRGQLTTADKQVPSEALLRNILVQQRLKAEREAAKEAAKAAAEVAPSAPTEAVVKPAEVTAAEAANARAEALTAQVEARRNRLTSEVSLRLQSLGIQARETWRRITQRPALAFSSAVALASLALLSSSAGFTPPVAAEAPQPTPIVRQLSPEERQAVSQIEMPRLATSPAPVTISPVSISRERRVSEEQEIARERQIIKEEMVKQEPSPAPPDTKAAKPPVFEPQPKERPFNAPQASKTEEPGLQPQPASEAPKPAVITPETRAQLTKAQTEIQNQLKPEEKAKIEENNALLGPIVDQYLTLQIGGFNIQAGFGENGTSYGKMTATRTPEGIFKYAKGNAKEMQAQIDKLSHDPRFADRVKNIKSEAEAQQLLTEMGIMIDCAGLVSNILTEALAQKGIDFYRLIGNRWGYVSPVTFDQLAKEGKLASIIDDKAINYRSGDVVLFYLSGTAIHATIISNVENTPQGTMITLTETSDVVDNPHKGVHEIKILVTDPDKPLKDQLFPSEVRLDQEQWRLDTGKILPAGADVGYRLRVQETKAVRFKDL